MPDISVINNQRIVRIPSTKIIRLTQKSARKLALKHESISIVFVGARRMRAMNKKYLNHDYATDVITFEGGDIVICPSIAQKNAVLYQVNVEREICLYVVHGLLHLAGYDDKSKRDIKKMRNMEAKLMSVIARSEVTKQSLMIATPLRGSR